jgi:hypothetical protein
VPWVSGIYQNFAGLFSNSLTYGDHMNSRRPLTIMRFVAISLAFVLISTTYLHQRDAVHTVLCPVSTMHPQACGVAPTQSAAPSAPHHASSAAPVAAGPTGNVAGQLATAWLSSSCGDVKTPPASGKCWQFSRKLTPGLWEISVVDRIGGDPCVVHVEGSGLNVLSGQTSAGSVCSNPGLVKVWYTATVTAIAMSRKDSAGATGYAIFMKVPA